MAVISLNEDSGAVKRAIAISPCYSKSLEFGVQKGIHATHATHENPPNLLIIFNLSLD